MPVSTANGALSLPFLLFGEAFIKGLISLMTESAVERKTD
jgi:hypothetical protein